MPSFAPAARPFDVRGRRARAMMPWRPVATPAILAGTLAATLAAVLALELRPGKNAVPRALPPVRAFALSIPSVSPQTDDAMLLARPLFAPSRRPFAGAAPVPVARTEAPPHLVGVVEAGGRRSAVFALESERTAVVPSGERVGGFLVRSIGPETVTLEAPSGEQVLHLAFQRPGGGAPVPAAAPASPVAGTPAPAPAPGLPGMPVVRFTPLGLPIVDPRAPS